MTIDYQQIIDLRKKHGYTAKQLAEFLKIPYQRLNKWETKKASPKTEDAEKLQRWKEKVEAGEIKPVPKPKPTDLSEIQAAVLALTEHYCNHVAPLIGRSPLRIHREILDEAKKIIADR